MLVITLRVGESILAGKLFELHLRRFVGFRMEFELEVLDTASFLVLGRAGGLVGGMSYPQEPGQVAVADGGRLKTQDCEIEFQRIREGLVKLLITAPPSVRITRPSKHGTSLRSA